MQVTKTAAADVNLEPKPADLKPAVSAVNDEVASYMNNTVHAQRKQRMLLWICRCLENIISI